MAQQQVRWLYLVCLVTAWIEHTDSAFLATGSRLRTADCAILRRGHRQWHHNNRHRTSHGFRTLDQPVRHPRKKSIVALHVTKPDLDQQNDLMAVVESPSSSLTSGAASDKVSDAERRLGVWVLLTVPLAWGTFEPAVRYVYAIQPPVPGFVFSVGYYLVAAITLALFVLVSSVFKGNGSDNETEITSDMTPLGTAASENKSLPLRGGFELGTYLFVGNAFQVLGLKTVPSDRAAFLLQLTTIFVPLVQSVFAGNSLAVPIRTWIACIIALSGVAVISLDGKEDSILSGGTNIMESLVGGFSTGDLLIVLAAFSYTFHCIRLERFAKETSAIKLAACKAATETAFCGLLVTSLILLGANSAKEADAAITSANLLSYAQEEGRDIAHYFESMSQQWASGSLPSTEALLPAVAAVLWTGWIGVAYTIYAQSFGQSRVIPADANLIYTIQPICTAVFAWLLLGESLGPLGYLGGAIIGFAVYLVIGSDSSTNELIKENSDE